MPIVRRCVAHARLRPGIFSRRPAQRLARLSAEGLKPSTRRMQRAMWL